MSRSFGSAWVAVLAAGVVAAGCGGGGGQGGGAGGGVGAGGTGEQSPQNADQAIAQCEQSVRTAPQLSSDVRSELERVCRQAAEGDEQAVRKATKKVCKTIVEESVPAGAARQQALGACRQGP